jgi:nucleoside-diphosphate-sugar epimerase/carbamoylphosphate synthase large subunit
MGAQSELEKKSFNIGISCIGSGVGQSVIDSLRLSRLPIKTIGLGTNPFAYGAYDCDTYDYTPTIYANEYIEALINKYHQHNIDLIIPGLDDDVLILAKNKDKLVKAGVKTLIADEEFIVICRDKERMSVELNKVVDVFVKAYNKSTLEQAIDSGLVKLPVISKPRCGFASKGIEIIRSKNDLCRIADDHIIQEMAIPAKNDHNFNYYMEQIANNHIPQVSEISIQVVVGLEGNLMGRMASYNKLKHGVPIEILPFENKVVWEVVDKLMPTFLKLGLRGPLNIQGRMTENGLKLFEMNPRFTGITGLRALMGFNEVEACVKEWLNIDKGKNQLRFNYNRFGMRQTADKSVSIERNERITSLSKQLHPENIKKQKTVLVTGACGHLGQHLINKLSQQSGFEIWAFGRDKHKTTELFQGKVAVCYDNKDLNKGFVQLGNVDILLHLGFARSHCGNQQIAESMAFTNELFTRAVMHHIPAIINISSQSVYGLENPPLWTELTLVAPSMPYALAKYATELMLQSLRKINNQLCFSSIRLSSLSGACDGLAEVDFLYKIVEQALAGKTSKIMGGKQELERLDVRDAVDALMTMLRSNPLIWKPVYNLGSGAAHNIINIAEKAHTIAGRFNGGNEANIIIEEGDINMKYGMDSSLFYKDMNWKPQFKLDDTIESLVQFILSMRH